MNSFTLVRTVARAITSRRKIDRIMWGIAATVGVALVVGEQLKAQEYCSISGEFYGYIDEECPDFTNNGSVETECTFRKNTTQSQTSGVQFTASFDPNNGTSDHYNGGQQTCFTQRQTKSDEGYTTGSCKLSTASFYWYFQYSKTTSNPCKSGSYDVATDSCIPVNEADCLCTIDDLPANIFGGTYPIGCDRPAQQQCSSGSYIADTDTCPPDCEDFNTCVQDACENESNYCGAGESIDSVSYVGGVLGVNCTAGGSYCGYDEPTDEGCDDYSSCLAEACVGNGDGLYLDGFIHGTDGYNASYSETGNLCGDNPNDLDDVDVEVAEPNGPDGQTIGTNQTDIAAAINESADRSSAQTGDITTNIQNSTTTISTAISRSSESSDQNSKELVRANDRINDTNKEGFEKILDEETDVSRDRVGGLGGAPIILAGQSLSNVFTGSGSCPTFSVTIPAPISESVSTQLHCQIFQDNSFILSAVFIFIYAYAGYRIIASA